MDPVVRWNAQGAGLHSVRRPGESRYVKYGAQRVPYWEAGALIEPYSLGYFGSSTTRAIVMALSMEMRGEGGGRWGNAPEKDNTKSPG